MKVNKGFKFKVEPNKAQIELINKTFGCCRWIYNQGLDFRTCEYELNNNRVNYKQTSELLTKIKQLEDYCWLKEIDATALQSSLRNLDNAFKKFFKKETDYPKFKFRHNKVQSYTSKNNNNSIKLLDNKHVQLPKLGSVRIKLHRSLPAICKINNATISKRNNKYYVSLNCEYEIIVPTNTIYISNSTALDYSSAHFAETSEHEVIDMPHYFRIYEAKLARENRKLSRMELHSMMC